MIPRADARRGRDKRPTWKRDRGQFVVTMFCVLGTLFAIWLVTIAPWPW